jgi:hypothetical protein
MGRGACVHRSRDAVNWCSTWNTWIAPSGGGWDCEDVLGRPRVAVGQSPTLQVAGRAWVAGAIIGVPRGTLGLTPSGGGVGLRGCSRLAKGCGWAEPNPPRSRGVRGSRARLIGVPRGTLGLTPSSGGWDCEDVLGRPRVAVGQSPTLQVAGRVWASRLRGAYGSRGVRA